MPAITDFDFSPGESLVAISSAGTTRIFSSTNFDPVYSAAGSHVTRFMPNGRQIALMNESPGDMTAMLFDLKPYGLVRRFQSPDIHNFTVSDDGRIFAVARGTTNCSIRIYDMGVLELVHSFQTGIGAPLALAVSPDNAMAAATTGRNFGYYINDPTDEIILFDTETGNRIHVLEGHDGGTTSIQFSPDGARLISGGYDQTIRIWDPGTGEILNTITGAGHVVDLDATPDFRFALAGNTASSASLVNLETGEIVERYPSEHHVDVRVEVSHDGTKALTLGRDGNRLHLWDIGSAAYPDGETPTARPLPPSPTNTPIPTATPTPNPRPVVQPLVSNLGAEFAAFYPTTEVELAVDPRNGDLYALDQRYGGGESYGLIRGPIDTGSTDVKQAPIHATLPKREGYGFWADGFVIAADGTQYLMYRGYLVRIRGREDFDVFEPLDPAANRPVYIRDLAIATNAVAGAGPGSLIGLGYDEYYIQGRGHRFNVRIFRIDFNGEGTELTTLLHEDLPIRPSRFAPGPDGRMHIAGREFPQEGSGLPNTAFLYRWEANGSLTRVHELQSIQTDVEDLIHWPADNALYLVTNNLLLRVDPANGAETPVLPVNWHDGALAVSPDGGALYTTARLPDDYRGELQHIIQKLALNAPFPEPGEPAAATPFPTALPIGFPTATPTPTPTHTPSPTPAIPSLDDEHLSIRPLARSGGFPRLFSVNPNNGRLMIVREIGRNEFFEPTHGIAELPELSEYTDIGALPLDPVYPFSYYWKNSVIDMDISETGPAYVLQFRYRSGSVIEVRRDGASRGFEGLPDPHAVLSAPEGGNIPNAKPGDVLVLHWNSFPGEGIKNRVVKYDPAEETPVAVPLIDFEDMPGGAPASDIAIGPGGKLYVLFGATYFNNHSPGKIFEYGEDGVLREWLHHVVSRSPRRFAYLPADMAFYVTAGSNYDDPSNPLFRISAEDKTINRVGGANWWGNEIEASLDGKSLYLFHRSDDDVIISELTTSREFKTPSPTPDAPAATPTPVPGWLVLDGFGGIHASDPDFQKPVLPYFAPFDIVRDIEPDPLGRGWYMLDGYGGIHTSPPGLPKPQDLPYFGFDIARNLEIELLDNGELRFYLLDGFGAVHPHEQFEFGYLPYFGEDIVRDLEPHGDNWLTLDAYGNIYSTHGPVDDIRFADWFFISPVMRAFKRFPDETTVMMDYHAGRHTNPFYPAHDAADALPSELYFPWMPIIWDLETIPAR